ncbi:MAG: sigma 54-interacting transcriptional regulator, partial [Deltaproteobacteria bacterium]|nr:sigma 54-interacting transcriptional regulator [Deltaproteobacteria bacterium]
KTELTSDFRVVAATNGDLDKLAAQGRFRRDLLFRLRSVVIHLPPLRERKKDIRSIATYYLDWFCARYGMGIKGCSAEFVESLDAYTWPGNVRELIHAIEVALTKAGDDPMLFRVHLPNHIRVALARAARPRDRKNQTLHCRVNRQSVEEMMTLRVLVESVERQYLEDLIARAKGNIKEACRISGLSRSRFYARLKKYDIRRQADPMSVSS